MDSIERLIRENAFELSGIFGFESLNTVYTRVNRLAASDGLVGFAIDALREAFWGEHASRLVLVGYEPLAKNPHDTLKLLYDFLGEHMVRARFRKCGVRSERVRSRAWHPRACIPCAARCNGSSAELFSPRKSSTASQTMHSGLFPTSTHRTSR
jgi:sulfotransferase